MKKSRRIVIAMVVIAVILGWVVSRRIEVGPAAGRAFEGGVDLPVSPKRRVRIGTFNIHRCKGLDGEQDVARVAELLQGLDIVGLNEVYGNTFWGSYSQAEDLGGRLQLAWLFSPVSRRLLDGDFGNGVLANLPIRSWQKIPLPLNKRKSVRAALLIVLETGDRPINLVVAHLDHRDGGQPGREGHKQLDTLIALFLSLAEPAILMGDFNAYPNDPLIKELQATPGVSDAIREAGVDIPPRLVDWIFLRGMRSLGGAVVENEASDHPMVWADVEIAETPTN